MLLYLGLHATALIALILGYFVLIGAILVDHKKLNETLGTDTEYAILLACLLIVTGSYRSLKFDFISLETRASK